MRLSRAMNAGIFWLCVFASFCFFFPDLCSAEMHKFETIRDANMLDGLENQVTFTPSESSAQLDDNGDVPIVNPTTPGSGMMSPPYMTPPTIYPPITNQYLPTTTSPYVNPPPPATTEPVTNPTPTPTTTTPTSSGGGSWCIANPSASQTSLQVALDYACGYGGTDCSPIQPGATCFKPNTLKDHASYAFNDYYHKNPAPTSCAFGGAAQLTTTDPSHGNCHFSSSTGASPTPPMTTSPYPPFTPSITPPMNPYTPGVPTGYGSEPTDFGSEPTGGSSGGMSISDHQSLLSIMACLMMLLVAGSVM